MTAGLFNTYGVIVLGFLTAWYWYQKKRGDDTRDQEIAAAKQDALRLVDDAERKALAIALQHEKTVDRLTEAERQLSVVSAAMLPLMGKMQDALVARLTHMHTPRMDELLTRIGPPSLLSHSEEAELDRLMSDRVTVVDDQIDIDEREAAKMFPTIRRWATEEALALRQAPDSALKLISMTATVETADGARKAILLSTAPHETPVEAPAAPSGETPTRRRDDAKTGGV